MAGFIISVIISLIAGAVSLLLGYPLGVAATVALIVLLALGFGFLVMTDDMNWFD